MIHDKPLEEMSSKDRKKHPIALGVLDYFPNAITAVANVSLVGNEQHNPGQPMHWAREKSQDHADCIARHLLSRGTLDDDGILHSAKIAWRALAMLELEIEASQELARTTAESEAQPTKPSVGGNSLVGSIADTVVVVKGADRELLKTVQDSVNQSVTNEYAWRSLTRRNWTVVGYRPPVVGDCYVSIGASFKRLSINAVVVKCPIVKATNPDERFIVEGGTIGDI